MVGSTARVPDSAVRSHDECSRGKVAAKLDAAELKAVTFTAQSEGNCASKLDDNDVGTILLMDGVQIKLAPGQDKLGNAKPASKDSLGRGMNVAAFDPAGGFKQLLARTFDTFGRRTPPHIPAPCSDEPPSS